MGYAIAGGQCRKCLRGFGLQIAAGNTNTLQTKVETEYSLVQCACAWGVADKVGNKRLGMTHLMRKSVNINAE